MRIVAAAGVTLGFAAFVGLGLWQLDRAGEKRALFDQFDAGGTNTEPVNGEPELPDHRFRRLTLTGRYLSSKQVLLDSMTQDGRVGYHVLTPLRPDEGGPWVMVNRGWIPAAIDAKTPPEVGIDESRRTIVGRIDTLPRPGLKLTARAQEGTADWPRIMLFPSLADIAAELDVELAQFQLLLDSDQADGFARAWQPRSMPPERHVAYAVQWFGLAATLAVVAAVHSIRSAQRRRKRLEGDH